MKNISSQYQELQEGKMTKHQFLRNARMMFPSFVTNQNSFADSVAILKTKGMLVEGDAVKGTPDKEPTYDSPTPDAKTKYKKQIEYLLAVPHNLTSIIFTINFRKEDYHYVSEIFAITPKQIGSAEVILSFRENFGLSYGGWNDTFKKYKDKYDYYIFNEDDYFFIEPNWDTYLVNKYEKSENCDV